MKLEQGDRVRGLVLFSGGLDSQLAVCLLREQGVDVQAIAFTSPFFDRSSAEYYAVVLNVELHLVDFTADIFALLENPPHGFGSCLNPCVDCHARMLRRAGEMMPEWHCSFLATGEVLNERPMSQNRESLDRVARDSGVEDLVLRPLSARHLEPTLPERKGWVDREKLLGFQGRGRKAQIELAAHFGMTEYPTPAGGCRLTEPGFCRRLEDLMKHEGLNSVLAVERLKVGRHFRLPDGSKLIVGRHQPDNLEIEAGSELYDLILKVDGVPGPTGLLPVMASERDVELGAAICARYADSGHRETVPVRIRSTTGTRQVTAAPATPDQCAAYLV